MAVVLAGLLAALFSYLANKLALRSFGKSGVLLLVPLVEEVSKTLPAFYLELPIPLTHGIFGLVEAVYDLKNKAHPGPPLLSFFGHLIFGGATYLTYVSTGVIGYGLLAGIILHSFWNLGIIKTLATLGGNDE